MSNFEEKEKLLESQLKKLSSLMSCTKCFKTLDLPYKSIDGYKLCQICAISTEGAIRIPALDTFCQLFQHLQLHGQDVLKEQYNKACPPKARKRNKKKNKGKSLPAGECAGSGSEKIEMQKEETTPSSMAQAVEATKNGDPNDKNPEIPDGLRLTDQNVMKEEDILIPNHSDTIIDLLAGTKKLNHLSHLTLKIVKEDSTRMHNSPLTVMPTEMEPITNDENSSPNLADVRLKRTVDDVLQAESIDYNRSCLQNNLDESCGDIPIEKITGKNLFRASPSGEGQASGMGVEDAPFKTAQDSNVALIDNNVSYMPNKQADSCLDIPQKGCNKELTESSNLIQRLPGDEDQVEEVVFEFNTTHDSNVVENETSQNELLLNTKAVEKVTTQDVTEALDQPWSCSAPPIIIKGTNKLKSFVNKTPICAAIKRYAPSPPTSGEESGGSSSHHTPLAKKIALDLNEGSPTDLIQMSMKELTMLLKTAKKQGRDEMKNLLSVSKPVVNKEGVENSFEAGITPLDRTIASPEPEHGPSTSIIAIDSVMNEVFDHDSDSDDSFVPPTPKSETKSVQVISKVPVIIGTGLSSKEKELVAIFSEQFGAMFSPNLTPGANLLVAAHSAITLKWLFARVKGMPVISIEWVEQCLAAKQELPIDSFCLEKPYSVPVPDFLKTLDLVLLAPFKKYSDDDLYCVLRLAGIQISNIENWQPDLNTNVMRRMIVGDNALIQHDEQKLKALSSMYRAPVVDIAYVLGAIESGHMSCLQSSLILPMSDAQLRVLGYPSEVLTPDDEPF